MICNIIDTKTKLDTGASLKVSLFKELIKKRTMTATTLLAIFF